MTALEPSAAEATLTRYQASFLDWLACAHAGRHERAVGALRTLGGDLLTRVAVAAAAGHVLDFDDTFSDGVAHVSAACAPAALLVAAERGSTIGEMLAAYAEGFEAMAAVAAASHPALYDGGWHPTAVCGPIGAAVAAAHLLGLDPEQRDTALAGGLLRAGGTRGAFGSDGKCIQVAMGAAAGVQGALLSERGVLIDPRALHGPLGFEGVLHARWATPATHAGIDKNWVKLHPSCLGTHAPIEAAAEARGQSPGAIEGPVEVLVNPLARQAAHLDVATTGLEAKFSIPYCVAYTLGHGPPAVSAFAGLDPSVSTRAASITVATDPALPPFGAVLRAADGHEIARVPSPTGSPERPATAAALEAKLRDLGAGHLLGALEDLTAPARNLLEAVALE